MYQSCYAYGSYDDEVLLYYDKERNIIVDDGGFEVAEIFNLISPNMLFLFKHKKQDMVVRGLHGETIELLYPEEDDCFNLFEREN